MRCVTWLIWLGIGSSLSGCATPRTTEIPIAVPCAAAVPVRPSMCAASQESRVEWLRCALIDRERLLAHSEELRAILVGCVGEH